MIKVARIIRQQGKFACKSDGLVNSKSSNEGTKFLKRCLHQSPKPYYPAAKELPLPSNIKDLASSEKLNFSPKRSRDINGELISASTVSSSSSSHFYLESNATDHYDDRIKCYDCSGVINLSSAMETNVPFPFISKGKPTHLNFPISQWEQKEKYVAEYLNKVHPVNSRQSEHRKEATCSLGGTAGVPKLNFLLPNRNLSYFNTHSTVFFTSNTFQCRKYCLMKDKLDTVELKLDKTIEAPPLSRKEKLKAAVRDYGAVVLVFHVSMSLTSLGCCYLIVASGIDLSYILKEFGADDGAAAAGTAAHFVIAYAVHKMLAPGRIAITLTAVPFIVRKLRKMGILKTPSPKPQ